MWGYESYPNTRTVDAHVVRLRQKLEPQPASPCHFLTVHGVGYRFVVGGWFILIVLIVDDAEHLVAPLEIALATIDGIDVVHLTTAQKAFEMLTCGDRQIAALVTDLHLAQVDTFDLIEQIRRDQRYMALPILVVTGDTDPETPGRLARIGANGYFAKPYSPSEIRRVLEALLHEH